MPLPENTKNSHTVENSPFSLSNSDAYQAWRKEKLKDYPPDPEELIVEIADPSNLSREEKQALDERIRKTNMAVYSAANGFEKIHMLPLAGQFGLKTLNVPIWTREDGVTDITFRQRGRQGEYAPYIRHGLSWHTDGYYNDPNEQVCAVLLHCYRPARLGGESMMADPEVLYIHLRDINPDFISAMMQPDALTIPANNEPGKVNRPAQSGPVFSIRRGHLHMRFTGRQHHIDWKDDPLLSRARQEVFKYLADETTLHYRYRLQPGQGLITNNVLHNRTAFEDPAEEDEGRLYFRARFSDRIITT